MQGVKANTVPLVSILSEDASLWLSQLVIGTENGVANAHCLISKRSFQYLHKIPIGH